MKKPASLLGNKNKFLILGCGFSGSFFAKTIRKFGCTVLTSSRSASKDPNSFIFNSEHEIIPDKEICLVNLKFYQKLFVLFISFSTILIIPESPIELGNICESYNSKKTCNVW